MCVRERERVFAFRFMEETDEIQLFSSRNLMAKIVDLKGLVGRREGCAHTILRLFASAFVSITTQRAPKGFREQPFFFFSMTLKPGVE